MVTIKQLYRSANDNRSIYVKKAELHCHSKTDFRLPYAPFMYDSVQTVEDIIEEVLVKNIKILCITDHNSLENYFKAKRIIEKNKLDILLIPGSEIYSSRGDILALGIQREIKPGQSPLKTIELIREQGGIAVAAHPYIMIRSLILYRGLGPLVKRLPFDAIEGLNASMPKLANKLAITVANQRGLPCIAGSDAHQQKDIGDGCMIFKGNVNSVAAVLYAIKTHDFSIEFQYTKILSTVVTHIKSHRLLLFKEKVSRSKL